MTSLLQQGNFVSEWIEKWRHKRSSLFSGPAWGYRSVAPPQKTMDSALDAFCCSLLEPNGCRHTFQAASIKPWLQEALDMHFI